MATAKETSGLVSVATSATKADKLAANAASVVGLAETALHTCDTTPNIPQSFYVNNDLATHRAAFQPRFFPPLATPAAAMSATSDATEATGVTRPPSSSLAAPAGANALENPNFAASFNRSPA